MVFAISILALAQTALAVNKSWNKIRYQGGTVEAKVNPFDWNTTLTLSSTTIEIVFAGRKTVTIDARRVIALTSGTKAYHRVADMLPFSHISTPVPLFGMIQVGKDHLIGIEFKNLDGSKGSVLLLIQKNSQRDLLQALSTLTGKPVDESP
jgi:hypothetical protein